MKQATVIIFLTLILSCNQTNRSQGKQIKNDNSELITNSTHSESQLTSGQWFNLAYIDSTVLNKSIFKYSWSCASLAYMVSFDSKNPDSIFFKGYHEFAKLPLIKKSNREFWAGDTIQHWSIIFNQDFTSLKFKEYMDKSYSHKADPQTYSFAQKDINFKSPSEYFIKKILKGKYISGDLQISLSDKLVSKDDFSDYYEISGLENAKTYSIVIDFWEMVPQMDLINLFDIDGKFIKQYNWTFDKDELILKNVKEIIEDGDFAGGEVTDIAYRLKKY